MDFTFQEKVLLLVALETKMDSSAETIKEVSDSRLRKYWRENLADYTALRDKVMQSE